MKHCSTIRVLEVIRQGQIGGGESHVIDLVTGFDRNKIEPIVLAFTGGQMIDHLRNCGIKCYVEETSRAFDAKVMRAIKKIIDDEKIDIIHAHGSRAASNLVLLARCMHRPFVYTVHGWSFHQDQSSLVYKIRAISERLICHFSDCVICVSDSNRVSGRETFGLQKAEVIENGINLDRFNHGGKFGDIRGELGIGSEDFIVGFIARVTLQKAPLDFVKAVAIAHKKNGCIKGLLVGDGDMKDEVYDYIHTHRLEDCFYLSPFRTDVPDLLNAIDVYCLPSLWEGLSIALLEAMAMRKALVVTPTDGTTEVITNGENGIVVDFNQPERLADAFVEYCNNPDEVSAYGRKAQEVIRQRFDSKRVSAKVTEIYQSLLQ